MTEANKNTDILWYHGESDGVVPFPLQKAGVKTLKSLGVQNVEAKSVPRMEHSAHPVQFKALTEFLDSRIAATNEEM